MHIFRLWVIFHLSNSNDSNNSTLKVRVAECCAECVLGINLLFIAFSLFVHHMQTHLKAITGPDWLQFAPVGSSRPQSGT